MSGFLSEDAGRMTINKEQWGAYVPALPDDAARDRVLAASQFHIAHGPNGHLDANVTVFIGAKHHSMLHPAGYWTGDDVHTQLDHTITIFLITHPANRACSSSATAPNSNSN